MTVAVFVSSNGRMSIAVHSHSSWDKRAKTISSSIPALPDLSRYNNPATAPADFQRGLKTGIHAARRAKRGTWNLNDETAELDVALDGVPVSQSMSFAFLRGFASGFRETYRVRFGFF